jgi:hypothetical protein
VLDAQIAAGGGRFRGIQRAAAWDPDPAVPSHRTNPGPGLFHGKEFRAGFAHLAPRRLTFGAWCYHHQIPDVTALARAFPTTTIILNHFGGPLGIGPYAGQGRRGLRAGQPPRRGPMTSPFMLTARCIWNACPTAATGSRPRTWSSTSSTPGGEAPAPLADRMPARIRVRKTPAGSRVEMARSSRVSATGPSAAGRGASGTVEELEKVGPVLRHQLGRGDGE